MRNSRGTRTGCDVSEQFLAHHFRWDCVYKAAGDELSHQDAYHGDAEGLAGYRGAIAPYLSTNYLPAFPFYPPLLLKIFR